MVSAGEFVSGVDRGWEDEGWKEFPEAVLVHGDRDVVVPYELAVKLAGVIGESLTFLFGICETTRYFGKTVRVEV